MRKRRAKSRIAWHGRLRAHDIGRACNAAARRDEMLQHNVAVLGWRVARVGTRPGAARIRDFHGILTPAAEMAPVLRLIERAARADCTVLVQGETGTGKELAAHAIHALSPRGGGPFHARNCATLSPTLLESELFGHVRGAFTGAIHDKKGVFALANRGTLLLDEIAEASPEIQGRLLRVLQEKTFVPVGATTSQTVDVRLIAASNKSMVAEVAAGNFREDLSFRLRVVPLVMPPLRERTGDAEALFLHYVAVHNATSDLRTVERVTDDALAAVRAYHWPGNVRELQSAVEFAFVVGEGPVLGCRTSRPSSAAGCRRSHEATGPQRRKALVTRRSSRRSSDIGGIGRRPLPSWESAARHSGG